MKRKEKYIWIIVAVAAIAVVGLLVYLARRPGKYDTFAQCISASGTKFYGAFWCTHCQNQKRAFGKSAKYLPYIECSTADGKGQLPVCTSAGVQSYPTWRFPDGTEQTGEVTFEQIAAKTSCALPAN